MKFVKDDPRLSDIFETMDMIFLYVFTGEVLLQLIYLQKKIITQPVSILDFLLVAISWFFNQLRIFRTALLIIRIKPLRNICAALISVYSGILSIGVLVVIVLYIYGVMGYTLYKDAFELGVASEKYFDGLFRSIFTLFQILCLDDWIDVAYELMTHYESAKLYLVSYCIISGLIFFNLFIAVFDEATDRIDTKEIPVNNRVSFRDTDELTMYGTDLYVSSKILSLEEQVSELMELSKKTQSALGSLKTHFVDMPILIDSTLPVSGLESRIHQNVDMELPAPPERNYLGSLWGALSFKQKET